MLPCYLFFLVVLICISGIAVLLLHHRAKHGNKDDIENYLQDSCNQWFRVSDIFNFKTCSHEMWIILLLLILIVCVIVLGQYNCE
jgi:hypothetical protein